MAVLTWGKDLAAENTASPADVENTLRYMGEGCKVNSNGEVYAVDLDMVEFTNMLRLYRRTNFVLNLIEKNPGITRYAIHKELMQLGDGNIGISGVDTILCMLTYEYEDLYTDDEDRLYVRWSDFPS